MSKEPMTDEDALIFDAHRRYLNDPVFYAKVSRAMLVTDRLDRVMPSVGDTGRVRALAIAVALLLAERDEVPS